LSSAHNFNDSQSTYAPISKAHADRCYCTDELYVVQIHVVFGRIFIIQTTRLFLKTKDFHIFVSDNVVTILSKLPLAELSFAQISLLSRDMPYVAHSSACKALPKPT
jgi:hypothetical protein